MLDPVLKGLGIVSRERERFLSIALLWFLVMMGLGLGRSATESYFLGLAGADYLPLLFLLNAVFMGLFSAVYSLLETRTSRFRLMAGILTAFAVLLALLRVQMATVAGGFTAAFAAFAFFELFLMAMQVHFWTYSNDLFDPREGKRIFPLIGGVGLAGLITGSLLTGPLYHLGGESSENLFLFWAGLLVLAVPAVYWTRPAARRQSISTDEIGSGTRAGARRLLSMFVEIQRIPLIRTLALLSIPMWLVIHTVDWLFLTAVGEMFPGRENDAGRAAFLGYLNGLVSFSGLLFQFFVTGWVLKHMGVAWAFLSYSVAVTLGAVALGVRGLFFASSTAMSVLHPRVWLAALARFLDESVVNSIYESANQLLFNAVPTERRGLSRAFINGVAEPVATALAGLLLLIMVAFAVPIPVIAFSTAALGVLWFFLALQVRRYYFAALADNLSSRDIDQWSATLKELGAGNVARRDELFLEYVAGEEQDIALLSLEYLSRNRRPETLERLCELLPKLSGEVAVQTMVLLGRRRYRPALPMLRTLLVHENQRLRAAAVRCIAFMEEDGEPEDFKKLLKDPDPNFRADVIVALLQKKERIHQRDPALKALEKMADSNRPDEHMAVAGAIRLLKKPRLLHLLMQVSQSKNSEVRIESIRAMGAVGDESIVPTLVGCLEDEELHHRAEEAIVNLGSISLPAMHVELHRDTAPEKTRVRMLRCLGEIAHPESVPVIVGLMTRQTLEVEDAAVEALSRIKRHMVENPNGHHVDVSFDADVIRQVDRSYGAVVKKLERNFIHAHSLRKIKNPKARMLLLDALERTNRQREHTALGLLEILDDANAVRAASANLRSRERRAVAESIELLEGAGPHAGALASLLERNNDPEEDFGLPEELDDIILDLLVQKQHPWFEACIAYLIGEMKLKKFDSFLKAMSIDDSALIRGNALIALKKLGVKIQTKRKDREVAKMAIDMERILFLRSVPLFADLEGGELMLLNNIAREIKLRKGHVVFRENDSGDALYVVLSGGVQVVKGKDTVLMTLKERDCFGEMAILDEEPRSATVRAAGAAGLLSIQRADFFELLSDYPRISFGLFKTISRRLRRMGELQAEADTESPAA